MLESLSRKFTKNILTFLLIFLFVKVLLGVGFFIGWQAEQYAYVHPETEIRENSGRNVETAAGHSSLNFDTVIRSNVFQMTFSIAVITTLLFFWTLLLLAKSRKDKKALENTKKALELEISKNENATSELHITHQQLSATSGQLDGIFHGTTDFIAAIDRNFRFVSFNDAFRNNIRKLFETEIELGMSVDKALALYPEKLDLSKSLWKRALAGEQFTANQVFAENIDETFHYEITYTPIRDVTGEIIGASQICRDVTERNLIAENLQRERDFASAIFDFNSSLILVLDREGRIIRFNNVCETVSGYLEEEVVGRIFWNILLPTEEIQRTKNTYQNLDFDTISEEYVNRWISKDEKIRYISWRMSAIKDENEINEYFVATGIDITEKRESETARRRMLEILENSTDVIRISDLQGQVIYLNPAGRNLLGLTDENEIAHLRVSSCHPEWVNEWMTNVGIPTAVKKGSWLGETAVKTLENKEIQTSQLLLAHRNKRGELEYFSTVIRDISSQKELEKKYAAARDSAVETTKLKSEFLASMSHEIRTPMNGIIGLAELLLNTDLNTEQRDYAETIQKSGDSLLTIINDILDFSKLEAGKLKFDYVKFDLNEIVESTLELFAKTVSHKNIELCLLIRRDVPTSLLGDPGRLRQVLTNLISNAVKFTSSGEIVIEIKNHREDSRPLLNFSVKDTGIGIAPAVQRNLFNAFTQANTGITREFGGTGLGLAISKQLVGLMHGEIGVESRVEQGSTFWFTAAFDAQTPPNQITFADERIKNVRILIVAANRKLKDILLYQTKSFGMLADEASTGKTALKLLKNAAGSGEPFEIVILDLALPEMKKLELAHRIKTDPLHRKTKLLLLPSIDDRRKVEKARKDGIEYFTVKPVKPTELFKTLVSLNSPGIEEERHGSAISDFVQTVGLTNTGPEENTSTMNTEVVKNSRILIAEDNLVNQKVILNQVTSLGYEVDLVENGQEVLDALQFKEYSLILMDCQMPVMDGFDATRKIRESEMETNEHIPIIAVTAHAIEGDRERCLSKGMDDYISKPTKQQVLADAINFWIDKSNREFTSQTVEPETVLEKKHEKPLTEAENIEKRLQELGEDCGDDVVLDCINLFLEDTSVLIDDLLSNLETSDFEKLAKDAHKLKGSAANMGAKRLPAFCQKLIEFARNDEIIASRIILKQINEEYQYLRLIYSEKKELYETRVNSILI
jgi:PAS domain S-box-containing protein